MRSNLKEFIEREERWMDIESPAYLRDNVMNFIDIGIYKRLYLLKVFKYASLSLLSVSIILSTLLILKRIEPTRMVFIYPHSDNIQNVEVIGNFNIPNEKVKMELDEERGTGRVLSV